jgi:hypothetical protein
MKEAELICSASFFILMLRQQTYTDLRPPMKLKINEITAQISRMWIRKLLT